MSNLKYLQYLSIYVVEVADVETHTKETIAITISQKNATDIKDGLTLLDKDKTYIVRKAMLKDIKFLN